MNKLKLFYKTLRQKYNMTKINIYKYLFQHCKWFSNYIRSKAKDTSTIILIELFFADNWNLEDIISKIPEKDKEKFKELCNKYNYADKTT